MALGDGPVDNDTPALSLPYTSEALASLVRILSVIGSTAYQRTFVTASALPDDPNAIPALYLLASAGPQRPGQLAVALHVSAPTSSRLTEKLVGAGLAHRASDPHDARASLISLTPRGHQQAGDLFRAGDDMMARLLSDWSARDRKELDRLLNRLMTAFVSPTPHPKEN